MRTILYLRGFASGVRISTLLIAAMLMASSPTAAHTAPRGVDARQVALYGVLRESADSTPIAGALVVAVDRATRTPRHTAVSNVSGRFAIPIGDTSGVDLRILRLGHRPFEVGAVSRLLPGPATVYVPARVLSLATLKVESRSRCTTSEEEGPVLAAVLSEIDKALSLSSLRAADTRYRATIRQTVDETGTSGRSVRMADRLIT